MAVDIFILSNQSMQLCSPPSMAQNPQTESLQSNKTEKSSRTPGIEADTRFDAKSAGFNR
jgi:hypothetical protein